MNEKAPLTRKIGRWVLRLAILTVIIAIAIGAAFSFSPVPGAMVLRYMFGLDGEKLRAELTKYHRADVSVIKDRQYKSGDADAKLDVYFPASTQAGEKRPTVVWTHGGAWLYGSKDQEAGYYQTLASEGFTVVSLDYSLAPGANYPKPIHQVNDALAYLTANADELHVDNNRIFMAGDSAGAQITSQMAVLITNPDNAAALGIKPAINPEQLRGVILHCGFYDISKFVKSAEISPVRFLRWGMSTMVWAYFGTPNPDETILMQMSAMHNATPTFPPTFISGGNGDPLTDAYSRPFAEKLSSMGVMVTTLFFPPDHQPSLGHEYQFHLDQPDAQRALAETVTFLREHSK